MPTVPPMARRSFARSCVILTVSKRTVLCDIVGVVASDRSLVFHLIDHSKLSIFICCCMSLQQIVAIWDKFSLISIVDKETFERFEFRRLWWWYMMTCGLRSDHQEQCAICCRVAPSFLRVGHIELHGGAAKSDFESIGAKKKHLPSSRRNASHVWHLHILRILPVVEVAGRAPRPRQRANP